MHFADGAEVQQGDPLFDIDARPFEVALKRAQANLAMARSTADNASEQAERYTTLINRGVASKEQFSQYLSTAESQKSVLDARQADVDEAQLSLAGRECVRPISGRAGSALLKSGNIVNANTDVLPSSIRWSRFMSRFPCMKVHSTKCGNGWQLGNQLSAHAIQIVAGSSALAN